MTDTPNVDISVVDFRSVWRVASLTVDAPPICAEVAVAACCSNCGGQPVVADSECDPCRKYRDRNGCVRPGKLIRRAAERHERKHTGLNDLDIIDGEFTPSGSDSVPVKPKLCICGCGREGDTYRTDDGLSKVCRDLAWHRAQRTAA